MKHLHAPFLALSLIVWFGRTLSAQEAPGPWEGNWEITYTDAPKKGGTLKSYAAIARDWPVPQDTAFEKGVGVGQSRPARTWIPVRDANSELVYSSTHDRNSTGNVGVIKPAADGSLKLKHPYGHLGHWGGESEVRLAGADAVQGTWKYGKDEGGRESWRRVRPRITKIEFSAREESNVNFGEPGRMTTKYSADDWAGGNRPGFTVKIYGENLWGHHVVWVDAPGINASRFSPITVDPKEGLPLNVAGIRVDGLFWSSATPGRKILHVDDLQIPFDLEITGYPEEKLAPVPELRFLRVVKDRMEPAGELRHGDEFCVEARYAVKPAAAPGKVQLSWTDGQPREVELKPTDDPHLFRSARLKLEPPAAR